MQEIYTIEWPTFQIGLIFPCSLVRKTQGKSIEVEERWRSLISNLAHYAQIGIWFGFWRKKIQMKSNPSLHFMISRTLDWFIMNSTPPNEEHKDSHWSISFRNCHFQFEFWQLFHFEPINEFLFEFNWNDDRKQSNANTI